MKDFFVLYDRLIDGVDTDALITDTLCGQCWTAVKTDGHFGMAMTTPVDTAPRGYRTPDADRKLRGDAPKGFGLCRKELESDGGGIRHGRHQCLL